MLLVKTQSVRRAVLGVIASLACALGTSGCGMAAPSTAQVRVIDASAGSGTHDIVAGSSGIAYSLGFGTVTSYVSTAPATSVLAVNAAGTTHTLASIKTALVAGRQYTLLVHGSAAMPQLLADQNQPSPAGEIALRFLHESRGVGSIDLYLVPPTATLATIGALPVAQGLAYGANTGYIRVATGTYTLHIVPHGTQLTTDTVPLFTGPSTTYTVGSASTSLILDTQTLTTTPVSVTTLADYMPATAE